MSNKNHIKNINDQNFANFMRVLRQRLLRYHLKILKQQLSCPEKSFWIVSNYCHKLGSSHVPSLELDVYYGWNLRNIKMLHPDSNLSIPLTHTYNFVNAIVESIRDSSQSSIQINRFQWELKLDLRKYWTSWPLSISLLYSSLQICYNFYLNIYLYIALGSYMILLLNIF